MRVCVGRGGVGGKAASPHITSERRKVNMSEAHGSTVSEVNALNRPRPRLRGVKLSVIRESVKG